MSIDQKILDQFEAVVESQRKRIADMKAQDDFIDYSKLDKLIIGVCGGDGIGPMITGMAQHALETLLADKVSKEQSLLSASLVRYAEFLYSLHVNSL